MPAKGAYHLDAAFTMARDFGIVRMELDDAQYRLPIDLYNFPDVLSARHQRILTAELDAGPHTLALEIAGANPAAEGGDKLGSITCG